MYEHHRRPLAHLLDSDRDVGADEMHLLLCRGCPDRFPQPALGLPVAGLVHYGYADTWARVSIIWGSLDRASTAVGSRSALPRAATA